MGSLLTKLVLDVGESLVLRRHELTTDLTHDGARGVQDILSVLCGHIALPLTSGLSSVQVGHSGSRMRTPNHRLRHSPFGVLCTMSAEMILRSEVIGKIVAVSITTEAHLQWGLTRMSGLSLLPRHVPLKFVFLL